jgi:hypothetical protein
MTGILRMVFCSELVRLFAEDHPELLVVDDALPALSESTISITREDPDWFPNLLAGLTRCTRASERDLQNFVRNELNLPDCLKYVHLGNPDLIHIVPD